MDLTPITQLLLKQIGLDHGTVGEKSIEVGVQSRMQAIGVTDVAAYYERLANSRQELQALTEELIVPETWFFRGFDQLRHMAEVARTWKPALPGQPLRVLSIPCSTGEEPYSIYMFLRHYGLSPEQIRITAVDISQRALDRAALGAYPDLSFRESEPLCAVLRHRFFQRDPINTVISEVRDAVHFRQDNLMSPVFLADCGTFDFIFCRNVMIYFDRVSRQQALQALDRLLAPNGYLFGGHAEPLAMFDTRLKSVGPPGAFAYQRAPAAAATNAKRSPALFARNTTPVIPPAQPAFKSAFVPPVPIPATPHEPAGSASPSLIPDLLTGAEVAANSGRLSDAQSMCEQHLQQHGPTASALCLLGIILQAVGQVTDAEKSFQKAVYLDPAHKDSLWHLTLLAEKRGDQRAMETFKRRLAARRVGGRVKDRSLDVSDS